MAVAGPQYWTQSLPPTLTGPSSHLAAKLVLDADRRRKSAKAMTAKLIADGGV